MPMVGDFAGPDATKRLLSRSSDWMLTHFRLFEQVRKHSVESSSKLCLFMLTVLHPIPAMQLCGTYASKVGKIRGMSV